MMSLKTLYRTAGLAMLVAFAVWIGLSLLWAPAYMVAAPINPVTEDPGSRGLAFENVEIPSNALSAPLQAWWIPAASPRATLIFVHGAGSNRTSSYIGCLDFYKTLNALDISVLTLDLRNHGNSPRTDSVLRMGLQEWADVAAASEWLDTQHPHTTPRLILGASMGGSVVVHAADHGVRADGLVLFDPQLDVRDSLIQGGEIVTGFPAFLFSLAAPATIRRYELPDGDNSPLRLAEQLRLPILLIQDWDDPVTRAPFAAQLAARNPQVTLARAPAVPLDSPCIAGKERWGSHVAAHECHPDWTRETIEDFLGSLTAL